MTGFLDRGVLNGVHEARIRYRPERLALPIRGVDEFYDLVTHECQIWGGATTPLIPTDTDGMLSSLYAPYLPGAAVDHVVGIDYFGMFENLLPPVQGTGFKRTRQVQLAAAMFDYGKQESQRKVEAVETLTSDDAWRGIYAACLGLLPESPNRELLSNGYFVNELQFTDFVHVDRLRVSGSLDDLLGRLSHDATLSPRRMSMISLSYGTQGSSSIRSGQTVLPSRHFLNFDAGPNILVVCTPSSVADLALLWNLRGATGDFRPVPVGVPVAKLSDATVGDLLSHPRLARNGSAASKLYITSTSISAQELHDRLGLDRSPREFRIVPPEALATVGQPGGLLRNEVLSWKEGRASFVPVPQGLHEEVLDSGRMSDIARMHVDLSVPSSPFPTCDDVRISTINGDFYGGVHTSWGSPRSCRDIKSITWPSPMLISEAIARGRELDLAESEPGRAVKLAASEFPSLFLTENLLHAPLLDLLESMAARQGFGWYKERLAQRGVDADPTEAVGPSVDELPSRSFADFQRVFSNKHIATRNWLYWAEQAKLIVKGFHLSCSACGAKQWVPVAAFAPPIVCRGCSEEIDPPFGDSESVTFRYRISERLRRVYAQDGIGHLIVAYFLNSIFRRPSGSEVIGIQPGMEIREHGASKVVGEVDVLLLTRNADFVPVEVKRTSTGMSELEVEKLDSICERLKSPWSAVAACQYASDVDESFVSNLSYWLDGTYRRLALTYDRLLEPRVTWTLGSDPFAWEPMSEEQIARREREFVDRLTEGQSFDPMEWVRADMLYRPRKEPNDSRSNTLEE